MSNQFKCKKHPKYKGIRKPISDCLDCWVVWCEAEMGRQFKLILALSGK